MAADHLEQAGIMSKAQSPLKPRPAVPAWAWWVVGGLFVATLGLIDFLKSSDGLVAGEIYLGRDFINVWTGGWLVHQGDLAIIYDPAAYGAFQRTLFGDLSAHNYSYPPVTFPLAAAFASIPYPAALLLWTVGTGALFVWAAKPWWPKGAGPAWLAVLTPAAIVNIWAGHYGFLIGALFLLGWRNLDQRPYLAGIFFGAMLIKPHLAILVPLALLLRGEWKAIASAAVTVAALVAVTGLWFGWQPWHDFLVGNSALQAAMIDPGDSFFGLMACSTATALLQLTGSMTFALAGQVAVGIGATALVWIAARRRVATRDLALLVATATFLLLPYSFNYDLTVVMIGALAIWTRADVTPLDHRLALYGFLAPQLGLLLAAMSLPLMPVLLAGLAFAQYRVAVRDAAVSPGRGVPTSAAEARSA
jgi:hypothetical protein